MSVEDIDNLEQKEMIKKRLLPKNTWCDWLSNYIPELIKTVGGAEGKIMSLFKSNTIKNYRKPTRVKNVYGSGKKTKETKTL